MGVRKDDMYGGRTCASERFLVETVLQEAWLWSSGPAWLHSLAMLLMNIVMQALCPHTSLVRRAEVVPRRLCSSQEAGSCGRVASISSASDVARSSLQPIPFSSCARVGISASSGAPCIRPIRMLLARRPAPQLVLLARSESLGRARKTRGSQPNPSMRCSTSASFAATTSKAALAAH